MWKLIEIVWPFIALVLVIKYWNQIKETSDKLDEEFINKNKINTNKIKDKSHSKDIPIYASYWDWLDLWLDYRSIDDKEDEENKEN
ncbi:hypothetical protein IR073_05060 [Gemella sp. 19428wG2_WT2a]|nr:hypothetical protein [Gemella sp. 19428wG2_WT2a]TFU58830.1 hypothetical protein E4T67_05020 [Gemella sp. WT2a]